MNDLIEWPDLKKKLSSRRNVRFARKKILSGAWIGHIDPDGDVWINERLSFSGRVSDNIDSLALQLLDS